MNPILISVLQNNPMMQKVKQMIGMVNGAQNPQAMMNQLFMNNPQFKQVMDLIQSADGDPQKAFYDLAQQKGINPQDVLDMLK